MKKQMYKIKKSDWVVTVKGKNKEPYSFWFPTLARAKSFIKKHANAGAQVQIFKVSYEFRDAYVVSEKKGKKK